MWSGNFPRRTESVTLRLSAAEEKHCSSKGNRSEYIRYLIQQDMKIISNIDRPTDRLTEKFQLEVDKKVNEELLKILENLNTKSTIKA